MSTFNAKEIFSLVKALHIKFYPELSDDEIKVLSKSAFLKLTEGSGSSSEEFNEFAVCKKVEKHLHALQKQDSSQRFNDLFKRLQNSNVKQLLNICDLMMFFLHLSETQQSINYTQQAPRLKLFIRKPGTPENHMGNGDSASWVSSNRDTSPSKPVFSIPRPSSFTNHLTNKKASSYESSRDIFNNSHSPISKLFQRPSNDSVPGTMFKHKMVASNATILAELIYSFQGISGDFIKSDPQGLFTIDPQVQVQYRSLVESLLEIGNLYNRLTDLNCNLGKGGSVGLAIQSAVRSKMCDYYGLLGHLQSEMLQERGRGDDTPMRDDEPNMTVRKLFITMKTSKETLQGVFDALNAIGSARGGAVISALHPLAYHGNINLATDVKFLLNHAGVPLMKMIKNWLIGGELHDPSDEFFISLNKNCEERDIWHNKFLLRKNLLPNIISEKRADMILRSGKAIHFLNVVCNQKVSITGLREKLYLIEDPNLLELFDERSELTRLVTGIFEETSALVMATLVNQFHLFQHFLGLRKYILLCQGDFANYLMDFLEPEMRKPADELQTYRLTGLLDAAIRASSAAFEDPEIIKRVTVKLLVASAGDCGFDVFGLHYIMHEPIEAAFKMNEGAYSNMFNFLWRTKRMWHVLQNMVRERWLVKHNMSKLCKFVPEVSKVLLLADRMSLELRHFARELQCYLHFEVIECVWDKFSESCQKAKTLDDVITAHDLFISTILIQTFQDPASRKFINDLRMIWELVTDLEGLEKRFLVRAEREYEERLEREQRLEAEGVSLEEDAAYEKKEKEFKIYLSSVRAQYSIFVRNYQDVVKKFLLELSMTKDHQLRMLSSRLDYNEYYKKSDSRITDSMKFSRCSDIFSEIVT